MVYPPKSGRHENGESSLMGNTHALERIDFALPLPACQAEGPRRVQSRSFAEVPCTGGPMPFPRAPLTPSDSEE